MKWISVKDQLPKVGKQVIVYYGFQVSSGYLRDLTYHKKPEKCQKWCVGGILTDYVTHWMELPPPPTR